MNRKKGKNLNASISCLLRPESNFIIRRHSSMLWKTKLIQKKIEVMHKSQSEASKLGKVKEEYSRNKELFKSLTEERKIIMEKNQKLQNQINACFNSIQCTRNNNEKVHQDALKIGRDTEELITKSNAYKREICEIHKEIARIEEEIKMACLAKYAKENDYDYSYDQAELLEREVKSLHKSLKKAEKGKFLALQNARKYLKNIEKLSKAKQS